MQIRAVYAETRIPSLRKLIRDFPLGVLTTAIPSTSQPLIQSSHIPWILDVKEEASATELGTLRGHLARGNPQSKAMIESLGFPQRAKDLLAAELEQEVLVLFTSPVHSYVTPKYYVETKPSTGKVVPTWDYSAVQAYGRAKLFFDSKSKETGEFLTKQIDDLSNRMETHIMKHTGIDGRPKPWLVSEAPEGYVGVLKKAIIGIEIKIDRLEGVAKMSQNKGEADRLGVIQGFNDMGTDLGRSMAEVVTEYHELKKTDK
ncbi:transcriptional regulator PAI 2-type [Xylariales sp. PMI_506]|nr:transcriptional regulator PAI 2-type [Xylariales sp. PMI_506]